MELDQQFVDYVVKAIVDRPDDVRTERIVDDRGVRVMLKVHPEDMGHVIGRSGATAQAVRTLLRNVGRRLNVKATLTIVEPEGSTFVRKPREGGDNGEGYAQNNQHVSNGSNISAGHDLDTSAVDNLII